MPRETTNGKTRPKAKPAVATADHSADGYTAEDLAAPPDPQWSLRGMSAAAREEFDVLAAANERVAAAAAVAQTARAARRAQHEWQEGAEERRRAECQRALAEGGDPFDIDISERLEAETAAANAEQEAFTAAEELQRSKDAVDIVLAGALTDRQFFAEARALIDTDGPLSWFDDEMHAEGARYGGGPAATPRHSTGSARPEPICWRPSRRSRIPCWQRQRPGSCSECSTGRSVSGAPRPRQVWPDMRTGGCRRRNGSR